LNEEAAIDQTIKGIPESELDKMGYDVEVVIVDNGSTDRTAEISRQAGARVIYEPRRGYGRAYRTGFENARGDIIVTADADLTYPVEDIPQFVKILNDEGLDFITTNRLSSTNNGAMSIQNKMGNFGLTLATRILFPVDIKDSQSGMWIFKRDILNHLKLRSDGMPLSQEIKLEACYFAKYRWKEIPIHYKVRVGEVKLRRWRDGFENLFHLVRKRIKR
jgi:glycosyltransferase involved in cell wall biosynthesis